MPALLHGLDATSPGVGDACPRSRGSEDRTVSQRWFRSVP